MSLLYGKGPLNEAEKAELAEIYKTYDGNNSYTRIHLESETPEVARLVNELGNRSSNLLDRLALTIVEDNKPKADTTD